jgi:FBP C-terminal treble-clef zinc-finger
MIVSSSKLPGPRPARVRLCFSGGPRWSRSASPRSGARSSTPRAGAAGRNGNSLGNYLCSDLACSLYLRGKRQPRARLVKYEETLTTDEKIDRAMDKLAGFVQRVAAQSS